MVGRKSIARNISQEGGRGDNVRFPRIRSNGENPSRAIEAALIQDVPAPEVSSCQNQRDLDAIRWHDKLEMRANMLVQRTETLLQIIVIVGGQRLWMRIQTERAQCAGETRHFE